MNFIKQASIDLVLEADVLSVIKYYDSSINKKGVNWFCKSPFKDEDTPSFCVNPVKNTWFDYASGFGGNAVSFVIKKDKLEFIEAIKKVADICHIVLEYEEVSPEEKKKFDEFQDLKNLVREMSELYQKQLNNINQ